MESFHKLMAQVYHPLSDSGNLEPAKHLMESLANEATRWASAPLPEKVNTAEMKSAVEALRTGTEKLAAAIKQGVADDEIELSLENLHAQFHKIMEEWNGEDQEHEHMREQEEEHE